MSSRASADRARVVRPRRRSDPNCAALADIDHRVLTVLCEHRVVRQDQFQRLFPDVPERTLRYRTRRLHDLGLAGRSRPYRERGSAPNHHWPTRRADCLVRGEPLPRGGERHTPNPVFLAHAAALTELYVTLATKAHTAGLQLLLYRREGEARETFKDGARERTLAPDAMLVLVDGEERKLGAFVEIDLGTMSHARLRFKAGLYAAYATSDAWREHHLFLPALLFLTTTPARASRFLKALAQALQESARGYSSHSRTSLVAAAGALALTPGRLLGEGLQSGELIEHYKLGRLPLDAERDAAGWEEQNKRRFAYLEWRDHATRQLARKAGPLGRLTHRPEDFYPQIDRQSLGVCRRCQEITYPAAHATGRRDARPACHYCHETDQVEAYHDDAPTSTKREVRL